MPAWALFVTLVGGVLVVSLAGLVFSQRFLPQWRSSADAGVVAGVAGMALTLFALVLAFAIVTLYNGHQDAANSVTRETNDLAQIDRDSNGFPLPAQKRIHAAVKAYVKEVHDNEFRLMRDGKEDTNTAKLVTAIFTALQSYNPDTRPKIAFYNSAVSQLNDAVAQRRSRLGVVNAALPGPFTALLFLSAFASIAMTCFITTQNRRIEFILVGCVALVVGAGMLTALLLEFPFSGSVAVSSKPFQKGFLPLIPLDLRAKVALRDQTLTNVTVTRCRTPEFSCIVTNEDTGKHARLLFVRVVQNDPDSELTISEDQVNKIR